jgi:murein DD-endopeptidase MepM/ murein hydrolase activator NlpD
MSNPEDPEDKTAPSPSYNPATWRQPQPQETAIAAPKPAPRTWPKFALIGCGLGAFAAVFILVLAGRHPAPAAATAPVVPAAKPAAPEATRLTLYRGEMDEQTFYSSAVAAGVDDRLVPEIAAALAYEFDFVRDIHPGDVFEVAVEADKPAGGGPPTLYYISLVTATKSKAIYRFQPSPAASADWYDAEGRSARRNLMRTPVQGGRVTSTFGLREHPVLGFTRMHKGVDFGVPLGTPVFASGDGVIGWVGPHGDHGNYVRIDHSGQLATAYAHLSAFAKLAAGTRVHQGDVIAYSGNTGISTGPHLHYEVIVGGQQIDPATYKQELSPPLTGETLQRFVRERDRIDALRQRSM